MFGLLYVLGKRSIREPLRYGIAVLAVTSFGGSRVDAQEATAPQPVTQNAATQKTGTDSAATPNAATQSGATQVDTTVPGTTLADTTLLATAQSATIQDVVVSVPGGDIQADNTSAVTELDSKTVDTLAINRLSDIVAVTPGVFMPQTGITPSHLTVFMRGFGELHQQGRPSIPIYIDDVYIPRTQGSNFNFIDLDTIDIARGPQGFTFGHSAEAGTISVHTKQPGDQFTGTILAGYGSYNEFKTGAALSGPILPGLLYGSFAFQHRQRDGYTYDVSNGHWGNNIDITDLRGKLRFTPNEKLEIITTLDSTLDDSDATLWSDRSRSTNPNAAYSDVDPWNKYRQFGASNVVSYALNDELKLKSITAYRGYGSDTVFDNTGDPFARGIGVLSYDDRSLTQETRLSGKYDRFNFVVGNWLSKENWLRQGGNNGSTTLAPDPYASIYYPVYNLLKTDERELAFFGQGTLKFTDELSLTFGGRWNYNSAHQKVENYSLGGSPAFRTSDWALDQKLIHGTANQPIDSVPAGTSLNWKSNAEDSWQMFTPKASIDYQWRPEFSTYFTFSKGQKTGGFDFGGLTPFASSQLQSSLPYGPEVVKNYEVGFRSSLWNNKVTLNGAIFYDDIDDVQLTTTDPVTLISRRFNAGKGHSTGIELESSILDLVPGLEINLSGGYLAARLDDFTGVERQATYANGLVLNSTPFDGARLPNAPTWQGFLGATYILPIQAPGTYRIGGNLQYKSSTFNDALNNSVNQIPDQTILNGFASYTTSDNHWTFRIDLRNALDERYPQWANYTVQPGTGTLLYRGAFYNEPRTIWTSVKYSF